MKVVNSRYFCPLCGGKRVLLDEDEVGDFYEGQSHHCIDCGAVTTLSVGRPDARGDVNRKKLIDNAPPEALKPFE